MSAFSRGQRLAAEGLGTLLLLAIVVGSGVMGETLAGGNAAVALLGNTIATGAGLYVLILVFGPVSGAHFNPAVTLAFLIRKEIAPGEAAAFVVAQVVGGVLGVLLAHAMFDLALVQQSAKARAGLGQALGEATATFGLVLTILGAARFRPAAVPAAVGLFITAGYWFTSSTSFANPAVTLARCLTDTFAGVRPADAPAFIAAQLAAGALATAVAARLFEPAQARMRVAAAEAAAE
ncbi:MAG: aquaporin [Parvularculaceae bacterium]